MRWTGAARWKRQVLQGWSRAARYLISEANSEFALHRAASPATGCRCNVARRRSATIARPQLLPLAGQLQGACCQSRKEFVPDAAGHRPARWSKQDGAAEARHLRVETIPCPTLLVEKVRWRPSQAGAQPALSPPHPIARAVRATRQGELPQGADRCWSRRHRRMRDRASRAPKMRAAVALAVVPARPCGRDRACAQR